MNFCVTRSFVRLPVSQVEIFDLLKNVFTPQFLKRKNQKEVEVQIYHPSQEKEEIRFKVRTFSRLEKIFRIQLNPLPKRVLF